MTSWLRFAIPSGVALIVLACSGGIATNGPQGTSGGGTSGAVSGTSGTSATSGGTSTGTSGGGGTSGGPRPACPATQPSGQCSPNGLECEYGDDPRPSCRAQALCEDGSWRVAAPRCTPLPSATCPASRDGASGQACSPKDAVCNYDGSLCECTNCTHYPIERCEGEVTWRCEAPATEAGCPAGRPRLGAVCSSDGLKCSYGCESGQSRECTAGTWRSYSSPGGCPVSTRAAKTDIHYLANHEVDALAEEAASLRLTSWRYTGKLDDGRVHVGYILEDAPAAPSSNMSRREVDLYAFASMTLALAQKQQREIDELKRQLARR